MVENEAELTADFRREFRLSFFEMGETYSFNEGLILIDDLLKDANSRIFYKLNGFDEDKRLETNTLLSHTFNLLAAANSDGKSKPPSYPAPWDQVSTASGKKTRQSNHRKNSKDDIAERIAKFRKLNNFNPEISKSDEIIEEPQISASEIIEANEIERLAKE